VDKLQTITNKKNRKKKVNYVTFLKCVPVLPNCIQYFFLCPEMFGIQKNELFVYCYQNNTVRLKVAILSIKIFYETSTTVRGSTQYDSASYCDDAPQSQLDLPHAVYLILF
jgi:hypothetical protein